MPYCAKCGTELSKEARFCPACGAPVGPPERVPHEKPEKREKEEKHEKREKEEKREKKEPEKGGEDVLGAFVGGSIIILLGVLFFLAQIEAFSITWTNWWWYFIFGLGCILIAYAALRAAVATYRGTAVGPFIGGVILLFIGLAGVINIETWWPLILMAVGIAIIVGGLVAVARSPKPK